jgi:hypothetical protein
VQEADLRKPGVKHLLQVDAEPPLELGDAHAFTQPQAEREEIQHACGTVGFFVFDAYGGA